MKSFSIAISLLCCLHGASAQTINHALRKELDSIYSADQYYRELIFSELMTTKRDSLAIQYGVSSDSLLPFLINKMNTTDTSNIHRIEAIISQYGYPGKSLVGEPTNEAAFFVIQHSRNIDKYLPAIKEAADKKELKFALYAMMLDRSLMYKGKEQIYGTQGKGISVKNKSTGQTEFVMIIWPIKDVKNVNILRNKAGFKETVEQNAQRLGITYKRYTIAQIRKMERK